MASIGRPSGKARESLLWRRISEKPETGFEPVTYRLQGGCSGQLSYSGGEAECRRRAAVKLRTLASDDPECDPATSPRDGPRIRARGAGRSCSRHPGGGFARGHARPDRAPSPRAAAVRRPDGLRDRRGGGPAATGVRGRRLGRRGAREPDPARDRDHGLGGRAPPDAQRAQRRRGAAVERRGGHAGRARGLRVRAAARPRAGRGRAERLPQRCRRRVQRRGGHARRALRDDGGAGLRLGAPARDAARAGQARRAHRAAQPPRVPRAAARGARRRDGGRGRAARPRSLQGHQRRARPRRGRSRAGRRGRAAALGRARRPTPSAGSAARSSC